MTASTGVGPPPRKHGIQINMLSGSARGQGGGQGDVQEGPSEGGDEEDPEALSDHVLEGLIDDEEVNEDRPDARGLHGLGAVPAEERRRPDQERLGYCERRAESDQRVEVHQPIGDRHRNLLQDISWGVFIFLRGEDEAISMKTEKW